MVWGSCVGCHLSLFGWLWRWNLANGSGNFSTAGDPIWSSESKEQMVIITFVFPLQMAFEFFFFFINKGSVFLVYFFMFCFFFCFFFLFWETFSFFFEGNLEGVFLEVSHYFISRAGITKFLTWPFWIWREGAMKSTGESSGPIGSCHLSLPQEFTFWPTLKDWCLSCTFGSTLKILKLYFRWYSPFQIELFEIIFNFFFLFNRPSNCCQL